MVIVERNRRVGRHEIDLIAEDGETLVFVEVRGRRSAGFAHPLETIDARKQQHLVTAAEDYLRKFHIFDRPCRFDVVTVVAPPGKKPEIEHYPAAFMAG